MLDTQSVREQFRFLDNSPTPVYLDNASTSPKPESVLSAMTDYYRNHNGNVGRGNHRLTRESTAMYEQAREAVAKFIHAENSSEVVFTHNATESANLIVYGYAQHFLQPDDVIVLTQGEHHSNLLPWLDVAKQTGARVEYIQLRPDGTLDINSLIEIVTVFPVKFVSITYVSNVLGTINPIRKIAEVTKKYRPDALIAVDASQAVGHIPVNIDHLNCDFLFFSGHKMYGPMGIGVLYGKSELLNQFTPLLWGGGMINDIEEEEIKTRRIPSMLEAGTPNVAGAVGLYAAIDFINHQKIEHIMSHEIELTKYVLEELQKSAIEGLHIIGQTEVQHERERLNRLGIVSFYIDNIAAEDIGNYLDDDNVMVRSGHHCTIPLHKEVFKTSTTVRVSLAVYNTTTEIDQLIDSLKKASQMLR
ncbi:cysteine desulfurase [candidate division WWE3 bacterium]|nr:cysteine desulfurase [candidate division WWE3 bacterium]